MDKIYISTLGLIVTNKCNLDCAHCLRGCKNNNDMSDEVVKATLSQIKGIGNLAICGGEPTMGLSVIKNIFDYIITNHILVEEVTATINGTIYSEEFIKLLDTINEYISKYNKLDKKRLSNIELVASLDDYHINELNRLNLGEVYADNISKYSESIHFYGLRGLDKKMKLFREGNALNLPKELTVDLRPMDMLITYVGKDRKYNKEDGMCNIGPIVTINTDGIVTECDASIENQQTKYNYGNVLEESIEEIVLNHGILLSPKKWEKVYAKELKRYDKYNK